MSIKYVVFLFFFYQPSKVYVILRPTVTLSCPLKKQQGKKKPWVLVVPALNNKPEPTNREDTVFRKRNSPPNFPNLARAIVRESARVWGHREVKNLVAWGW